MTNNIAQPSQLDFLEKMKRKFFDYEDLLFAYLHRLDLGGRIPNAELVSDNKHSKNHATAYNAVRCGYLRELFDEVRKTGIPLQNFVDVGSGKGKACFYASRKMRFEKIVGIDFSKPLVDKAIENNLIFKCDNIHFYQADATDYKLPNANNLIFMYNPFDNIILEQFIENNLDHFKEHPSLIAYVNDFHRKSLTTYGFDTIFRDQTRRIAIYRLS